MTCPIKRFNSDAELRTHVSHVHGLFYAIAFGVKGKVVFSILNAPRAKFRYQESKTLNVSISPEDRPLILSSALVVELPTSHRTR